MTALPRILVVDPIGRLGGIVKSGMVMLNRPHVMVEVPSIQEAFDEISRSSLDLMVTAYFLGENTPNGIDLAERAIREQAGMPIIIMADEFDSPPDLERVTANPFQFLTYPPGEQFFRALRIGLDGEEVVQAEEGSSTSEFNIGPIPHMNLTDLPRMLHQTLIELGAIGAFVSDRAGRIFAEEGAIGYIDKQLVAATVGPLFPRAVKVAPQVGGTGWSMIYFDGERYDIFALALGYHHFMVFLFEGDYRQAVGEMMRLRRRGLDEFIDLIGSAAWTYEEVVSEKIAENDDDVVDKVVVEKRSTIAIPAVEVEDEYEDEEFEDEPFLDPVEDLDVDLLFSDDLDDMDDLFGDDVLDGDEVFDISAGSSVSFDEAQDMGLLGD